MVYGLKACSCHSLIYNAIPLLMFNNSKLNGLAVISYLKFHFFHTCWYFRIFRDLSYVAIYPSCRNDIFSAREPNIWSMNEVVKIIPDSQMLLNYWRTVIALQHNWLVNYSFAERERERERERKQPPLRSSVMVTLTSKATCSLWHALW